MATMNLDAIPMSERTLEKTFAPNFLASVGAQNLKKPAEILYNEICAKTHGDSTLSKILNGNVINVDIDIDIPEKVVATADLVFVSYMLSSYYKKERAVINTANRFKFNVGARQDGADGVYTFTCMKGTAVNVDSSTMVTDQDMIHASILGLNCLVSSFRKHSRAGMHPLSRVAANEENIRALAEYLRDEDKPFLTRTDSKDVAINTAVKLYNTACTRKAHQFYGSTSFYYGELAAATLITGVMSSPKMSPSLIQIANSSLAKISRIQGGLNSDVVLDLMEFTVGSGSDVNAQALFDAFKGRKSKRFFVPMQSRPVGPVAYSTSASALPAAEEPQVASSPNSKGAIRKNP